jgi:hypothetical protein
MIARVGVPIHQVGGERAAPTTRGDLVLARQLAAE